MARVLGVLNKKEEIKIKVAKTSALRWICDVTRLNRIRNKYN